MIKDNEVYSLAKNILDEYWLTKVRRIAIDALQEGKDNGIIIYPPRAEDYVNAKIKIREYISLLDRRIKWNPLM